MQIRNKLLVLLLVMALVPLCVSAAFNLYALKNLGDRLATDTRQLLDESAQQILHSKVDDYRRILQRDQQILRLALASQANEVEERLADDSPKRATIYFSANYDRGDPPPTGLKPSDRHFRSAQGGVKQPMPISYEEQVILLVEKRSPRLDDDLARLSTMTSAYQKINRVQPRLFFWQYTALESGIHSSFPGHGGYPEGYDPRTRSWYMQARQLNGMARKVVTDATTGIPILTLSQPVYYPDARFAGVTAIDVVYSQLFSDWELPASWSDSAETLLASLELSSSGGSRVLILLRASQLGSSEDWQQPPEQEYLESSSDPAAMKGLVADIQAGRSGVSTIQWHGEPSLIAYSAGLDNEPFPLVIVPLKMLHAPAEKVEKYLREKIVGAVHVSGLLLLAVLAWVLLTAYSRARSVTRPVKDLASAANRLAEGNYSVKVEVSTGDELQALGETFNEVGPKLLERETLKQSLHVAREIQQRLLPKAAPELKYFDLAGKTLYCDETGGDYFDFIPIDDQNIAIVVGDVTGHGIGSALLMATARSVLRSVSPGRKLNGGALLSALNQYLEQDTSDALFMTLFYGILDIENRLFHWVSAGHGPAFHYQQKTRRFTELNITGIPLGIMADARFEKSDPIEMAAGDILLIGTDGIWESLAPDGDMFGIERMLQVVSDNDSGSAGEVLDAVVDAASRFRQSLPQEDDLTLLVIKGRVGVD